MKQAVLTVIILIFSISLEANQDSTFHFALDSVKKYCNEYQKSHKIPGMSISIIKDDSLEQTLNFGLSDISNRIPVSNRTRFRIASLSKPITSAGIMVLLDKGLISLDDTIQKHIKDFPLKKHPVQVKHLLYHAAGIRHYKSNEYNLQPKYTSIKSGLDIFKNDTLLFEPGTNTRYSSYAYNLLGALIEAVSKKPYREFIFENLLKPAYSLAIVPDNQYNTIDFSTKFYYLDSNKVVRTCSAYDSRYKLPTGGYLSTSRDYSKLMNNIFNAKLFSDSILTIFKQEQKLNDGSALNISYGFRFSKVDREEVYWHLGSTIGASSATAIVPKRKLVITWLTNLNVNWNETQILQLVSYFLKKESYSKVK